MICCVEYDPETKHVVGYPKRIWRGATDRGCIEAPHLTKRDGWYYIMCAEGGTGYNHAVTMGRSRNVWGPYEPDPNGPLVTSQPKESNERADDDHLKPRYFNPDSVLQKSGHGSYVDLPNGETCVGVTNVGVRPTVSDKNTVTIETYLVGFDDDLYGQKLQLDFFDYLREEKKFSSTQELHDMIAQNAREAEMIVK